MLDHVTSWIVGNSHLIRWQGANFCVARKLPAATVPLAAWKGPDAP